MRRLTTAGAFAVCLAVTAPQLFVPGTARAAELLAYVADYCEWCEVWESEVGVLYDKTDEARTLPLRRVDNELEKPDDIRFVQGIIYTPTFVVIDRGREVGRILGYPGEQFFWGMLHEYMAKLPPASVAEGASR